MASTWPISLSFSCSGGSSVAAPKSNSTASILSELIPSKWPSARNGAVTNLGQHVDDGFPDDLPVAELRIVEASRNRQIQVDEAVAVLQNRNRQVKRKVHRLRTVDTFAEFEFVDHELVVARPTGAA